jgi:hypothetical protein
MELWRLHSNSSQDGVPAVHTVARTASAAGRLIIWLEAAIFRERALGVKPAA